MLNKAILMGRLVRDPEMRHTQSNTPVTSFTLAIDRSRSGQNGERQTDFIDIVAWRNTAEFVAKWFTKGSMCIVTGSIQSRNWEDKNGNKRVSVEVVADEVSFGETKKAREANGYASAPAGGYNSGSQVRPEGNQYRQNAPQQSAPAFDFAGGSDFAELSDDDTDMPF